MSKHFKQEEFLCPCCKKGKVNPKLIDKLETIREVIGNIPIEIVSGYRCKAYNQSIGGYVDSPHILGIAADTKCKLRIVDYAILADLVAGIRLGIYEKHLHLDIIPANPSRFWLVKKYGQEPIYSGTETNLKIFLEKNGKL